MTGLEPLPDARQMRDGDAWAIEHEGIASLELMERAGAGLARVAEGAGSGRVAVVCGKGNNAGDGLVAARLLRRSGRDVDVLLTVAGEELGGDALVNMRRLGGAAPKAFEAAELDGAGVVVDALLGTGFTGELGHPLAAVISAIGAAGRPVVAADVPSGVDASTGEVAGVAVQATTTATFHAAKPGLWISPGKQRAGHVEVIDIGIPAGGPGDGASIGLIGSGVLDALMRRTAGSTKFSSGHVLVIGGSRGLTGAPCLASEAAMRSGAGYVTACVPASLGLVFETRLLEVMTRNLPDDEGALKEAGADEALAEAQRRGGALILGPGMGRSDGAVALARRVARDAGVALVVDADALNAHAGRLADLRARTAPTVLTPHAGELGRLLEIDSEQVAARRLALVREAAEVSGAVVILKGDDTLVAEPGGRVGVSRGGVPALATAGTGDVLSGVLGAMLARGLEPFAAACAAVWLHARAGRLAAASVGADGVIASDVVARLPHALGASSRRD